VPPTDLIADLAKKSGLVWVTYAGKTYALWHEWVGDAICIVSGGTEQSLPDIAAQTTVSVSLRSKATRALAAQIEAAVEVVTPGSEHWESVTTALKAGRLNLVDGSEAIDRWSRESVVVRLVPIGSPTVPRDIDPAIGHTAPRLSR
jgi:hypothetical protein